MEHAFQLKSGQARIKGRRHLNALSCVLLGISLVGCGAGDSVPKSRAQQASQSGYSKSAETTQNNGGASLSAKKTTDPAGAPPTKNETQSKVPAADEPSVSEFVAQRFAQAEASRASPCAGLTCYAFDTPISALTAVMKAYAPRVISFGEAHTPAEFAGESTVVRFTSQLLPVVAPQSSYLLVELLAPPKEGCQKETAQAQITSDVITESQSKNNQTEYLALGLAARTQQVIPDILRASCEEIRRLRSNEGGILAYMELIAQLFARDVSDLLGRTQPGRPLLLTYGGALHNDAVPRAGRESWSFGPALLDKTQGHYLEVDLIIPELITESETWRAFAWYDAYQAHERSTSGKNAASLSASTLVIPWGKHSLALIFPRSKS